jgi:hypothetical protein
MKTTHATISEYNASQVGAVKQICITLESVINESLKKSKEEVLSKIWHGSPVWFINGNPIIAYSVRKDSSVSLMFFSGQSFEEKDLKQEGKFKAAEVFYRDNKEIKITSLKRWIKKAKNIQWDYANIIKRKGVLVKLTDF